MTLSRHSSRIYLDEYDVDGVLNVLSKEIGAASTQREQDVLCGMHLALTLFRNHDYLDSQVDFMLLAHEQMASAGIIERN